MRRITHREGAAPSSSPYITPAEPAEAVPFADKLRQETNQRVQPLNDEAHSFLSGGTRSKRKLVVIANARQQRPKTKSRMRTVLAAFGDCTVKRGEGKGVLLAAPQAQEQTVDTDEPPADLRIIDYRRLILIALILFSVFGLGENTGKQIRLRAKTLYEKRSAAGSSVENDVNVDIEEFQLSNLEKSVQIISELDKGDESDFDAKNKNNTSELMKQLNHTYHQAVFPPHITHISNLTTVYDANIETPYFWDVHFSGESVAEAVFSRCHHLVLAAEHGLRQSDYDEEKLQVFELDGNRYVNVDTTTSEGIQRASMLGLAASHLSDVIASPYLHPMSLDIFSLAYPGRMFAIFRHPVDRALGMYYYLARASWDPMYNPSLSKMNIDEYAKSKYIENNWLTRFLVKKPRGKLTHSDLLLAKKIIKYKCLVGIYDDMEASLARFQRYFGWDIDSPGKTDQIEKCRTDIISAGDRVLDHPISVKEEEWKAKSDGVVREGSTTWNAIARQNKFDMEIFEYVKRLYKTQGAEIFNIV